MISIPNPGAGTLAAAIKLRTDASQILGVDVDLILGPVVGTEGDAARRAREDAYADLVDAGFIWPEQISGRAAAAAEKFRELDELELAAGLLDLDLGAVA
ncbi:hypothetical protein [Streptomyces rubiginosohelvolus]|uniref:Uncharacterized protein n=1 Tax=Streptomyces rubiginosohelvolus TaxID=67362 RepID=A0ABQ3CC42_9ACTN|nr:hypothetical protein [Streptomyces pluricolorescens]GGZ84081.1 hypothetical protein GCM10010328_67710 [Streptomyces pluricolorescens]